VETCATCVTFDDISPHYLSLKKMKLLLEIINNVGVPCTFFIVPKHFEQHPRMDAFIPWLKEARKMGHELGQHGSSHGTNKLIAEFGSLLPVPRPRYQVQKTRLERGLSFFVNELNIKPFGFRAPFYLSNTLTITALANLGFKYNSSKTVFKPVHNVRFRFQNRSPIITDVKGVKEIPITCDYTWCINNSGINHSVKSVLRDFQWVNSFHNDNKIFVINHHPDSLIDTNYKALGKFLKCLTTKMSTKTDFRKLEALV
jgi:predicted deacetylase